MGATGLVAGGMVAVGLVAVGVVAVGLASVGVVAVSTTNGAASSVETAVEPSRVANTGSVCTVRPSFAAVLVIVELVREPVQEGVHLVGPVAADRRVESQ